MTRRLISTSVIGALLTGSALSPAMAQGGAQILPVPEQRPLPPTRPGTGGPAIQPPRPGTGGPAIQPPRPTYPGNQYGRTIRCESRKGQTQRCSVSTESRVQLVRRLGGTCTQNRTWGYSRSLIWVSNGCRAEFAYGRGVGNGDGWGNGGGNGGYYPGRPPEKDKDKGPSTGAIIAGVAVAGGLIALLATSGKKKKAEDAPATAAPSPEPEAPATFPPGPPAALSADLSALPTASRPAVQTCLHEAAKQIGATGGTRLSYDKLVSLEPGNGGWRFGASLTATYPDGNRTLPLYCRATPTKVVQLDFSAPS